MMALELQHKPGTVDSASAPSTRAFEFKIPNWSRRRLGDRDRMFFTEQLGLLLETGANLFGALQTLRKQSSNPAMLDVIDALMADIGEGRTFSYALAKHPKLFSQSYVNLIAASETGGFMHKVLHELKVMEDKRDELKSTLFSALSYPVFLILFSFAVVVFVLVAVFPKFGDLFASIHDQLPPTTKFLMATSNVLLDYWPQVLIGVVALFLLTHRWIATAAGRETVDGYLLRLPGLKQLVAEFYMAQVLRIMSLSLGNGVSMLDTLQACRDIIGNSVFRKFIDSVALLVEEGGGVSRGFERSDFVPPVAKAMLSTGEESGNLAKVAARVADYYELELTRRLKTLSKLAEPIMLLVMGAVVGLLVSSLILPIFKLSRAVT
jgi:type II secretory pathway component PulF